MQNPLSLKIKNQLKSLEGQLRKVVDNSSLSVKQSYLQTLDAGGKRLRPAIVFLCSQFKGASLKNVTMAAMAVELIHAASLIHDDIMDRAQIRRGQPTVYSKWGNQAALRVGDYLFAKAFLLLSGTDNFEAVNILSEAVKKLCEGEIEQIKSAFNYDQTRSYYYKKIACKTASLFKASAELGATFGNAPQNAVEALGDYGQNLGMAFQVYDDILDVEADEKRLGKNLGTDLKDGTLTLPILLAMKESKSQRLADIFTSEYCTADDIAEGLAIVEQTRATARAKQEARKFIDRALGNLAVIENKGLVKQLKAVCEYTIERYS